MSVYDTIPQAGPRNLRKAEINGSHSVVTIRLTKNTGRGSYRSCRDACNSGVARTLTSFISAVRLSL
jgi:hypothetical protein